MLSIPRFNSEDEYCKHKCGLNFWWPYIAKVLNNHNLPGTDKRSTTKCGFNSTYPVFLVNDIVIKFFGFRANWLNAFNTEITAHEYLSNDNSILAPHIIAKGELFSDTDMFWPYIISSKISGHSWLDTNLTISEKNNLAAEIGCQLRKIHALPTNEKLKHDHDWGKLNFKNAIKQSVLPEHLVHQVGKFISNLQPFDNCFVNGDIVPTHVFIENGRLTGIIDWGDATVTDRHYELGKLLDTFDWDKNLLKIVLDNSNWPVKKNFPIQALGMALYRQAVGLTQHNSFDVFYKLPKLVNLNDIPTLDDLAEILFSV